MNLCSLNKKWDAPRLIRLDVVDSDSEDNHSETATSVNIERPYRILVPIANPNSQRGLVQLAAAIAFNNMRTAIVNPLSLIELPEDYAYDGTPAEAEKMIQSQRLELEGLIQGLEPPSIRADVHPIIRISNNVARETAQIAAIEQADLILVGWHRPAFSTNRLGGRVGQILTTVNTDVAVFIDRGEERLENLLVPYSANIHDDLALMLALRLLVNKDTCNLQILRVITAKENKKELSYEVQTMMEQLPSTVCDRININTTEAIEPIQAVVEASAAADLTIAGTSRAWGIERQTLGRYTDELAIQCRSSLLITRRYSQVTAHLSSVLAEIQPEVIL
ncbi:hypothetical protein CK510_30600 [Brunnivagina elsteri CCALA 953]|uniref:UspA domain-containing protein n=1 Tax=Brunnivagina elsteri CCALA 953 TaxID=987040 RepID=A0A2A2T9J6_9CYAN|nr:hypothetical protein CK510_30600 [Calothrix elsteri CCALA 953]